MNIADYTPFSIYRVSGHSMEPTIKAGSRVLIWQWSYLFHEPKVSDIVIFKKGNEYWIKRIKVVGVDGFEVEGDNKDDSKACGLVSKKDIIGKVVGVKF